MAEAMNYIRSNYFNNLWSASLELDENAEIITYEEYHRFVDVAFGEVIPFGSTSYRAGRTVFNLYDFKGNLLSLSSFNIKK